MKLKDQVLSIKQVQELLKLGFDIEKHSSIKTNGEDMVTEDDFYIRASPLFSTMSIGDIIEVLPKKIKTYSANADKEIYFYLNMDHVGIMYIPTMIDDCMFCSTEDKLINNLFKTLVWCIKEKHI